MANDANYFYDDPAIAVRSAENTGADWTNGVNLGASNSPGIGIATDQAGLDESLPNWTLLDQFGNARAGQIGQCIGGPGFSDPGTSTGQEGTLPDNTIRIADPTSLDGTGVAVSAGNATLLDLAVGWTAVP